MFRKIFAFLCDESGAVNVDKLADLVAWTRNTEYRKGGYVSLTEPLPDYPLFDALVRREVIRSTPTIRYQIFDGADQSFEITQVGEPVQVSIPKHAKTNALLWSKSRTVWAYYSDEEAFNAIGSEDGIIDVVASRKVENDTLFRRNLEIKLANARNEASKNDVLGLKDWFPAKTTATTLELNGGADISAQEYTGVAVATTPRWGHAVCGFTKLSDDDLFQKISEFYHRAKYYVPSGAKTIDPSSPDRVILCNSPVFLLWERLQTTANDDLRNDLGQWRGSINFRSTPVKILHAQSEPDSVATPAGHALVYSLDLNTLKLFVHQDYNFALSEPIKDPNIPGQVKQWRELYAQLACINREKNLVAYTTGADFLVA